MALRSIYAYPCWKGPWCVRVLGVEESSMVEMVGWLNGCFRSSEGHTWLHKIVVQSAAPIILVDTVSVNDGTFVMNCVPPAVYCTVSLC